MSKYDFEYLKGVWKPWQSMKMGKPYKGEITNPVKIYFTENNEPFREDYFGPNLGYVIRGDVENHPRFQSVFERYGFRTSLVVSYDETTGSLETLNSRYRLISRPVEG
jgi:hypothetical protein